MRLKRTPQKREEPDTTARRPNLAPWLRQLADVPSCRHLLTTLQESEDGEALRIAPIVESPRPALVALLQAELDRPLLLLTAGREVALRLYDAVRLFRSPESVLYFPASDARPYERAAPDGDITTQRLRVLEALANWRDQERRADAAQKSPPGQSLPPLIVASARGLIQPTLSRDDFAATRQVIHRGMPFPPREMARRWIRWGYRSSKVVEEPGEFARRGGIVDIYPPTASLPLRIELFGDEVDSIREFDPISQRSRRQREAFSLTAPSEIPWWKRERAVAYLQQFEQGDLRPEVADELARDRHYLQQGTLFDGLFLYAPLLWERATSLLDHLPPGALVVLDEPGQIELLVRETNEGADRVRADLVQGNELPASFPLPYLNWETIASSLADHTQVELSTALPVEEEIRQISLPFAPLPHYGGRIKEVLEQIAAWRDAGDDLLVVSHQASRLRELLRERGLPPHPEHLALLPGRLPSGGWACPEASLRLLTDIEIFGWAPPRRRPLVRRPRRDKAREEILQRLQVGDYVVHEDQGIAIYDGLARLTLADGVEREYLNLRYAAGDRLYVPVDRVDRVRRYVGSGERPPALHRLGSGAWERTKSRVRKAVEDMAQELLELYAAREIAAGYAFSPDTAWQTELEAAFPYIETEDQLRAAAEVKEDMEQPRPMNRLVCGDVGYGKTEIALRAAFKAVMDGKQVAVLVPTTVLAQQHHQTFTERLHPFPVVVEMLSRFRSRSEQHEIVERLAAGGVDIVIGTHRLLSKDVAFKDLGLVVVDEEQRFGVRHKEHLKRLRREVDVLTLTATPIPRTLHMALTGLRDLSVIETPPEERMPIRTYVVPYDDKVVRDAILRELDRGGQVYFVHNRVRSIWRLTRRLQELVPEARFAVAHGQMPERELEGVMLDFVAGRYDVLVCTTIIESGLDIPNVNTILIDDAVFLGLSQLYQLRGRVGRGAMRAYAYLLYHPGRRMGEAAQKRLQAILEATDLGAGFQIAMRDLEIRGTGNLLGAEQSGHIAAVGFDLYTRLLARAVEELRGKEGKPELERLPEEWEGRPTELREPAAITLDLPVQAYLPEAYVEEAQVRLQVYRRLSEVRTTRQVQEMAEELRDRFGELPPPAQSLIDLLRIKVLALRIGVSEVRREAANGLRGEQIVIIFPEGARPTLAELPPWIEQRLRRRANLVWLDRQGLGERWLEVLQRVLLALRSNSTPGKRP